LRNFGKVFF